MIFLERFFYIQTNEIWYNIRNRGQTTSKGNQAKYTNGEIWVKTNYLGYEDIAEYVCGRLLSCSNHEDFVQYELCTIDGEEACYSKDFLASDETILTLGRILALYGITQNAIDRLGTPK